VEVEVDEKVIGVIGSSPELEGLHPFHTLHTLHSLSIKNNITNTSRNKR